MISVGYQPSPSRTIHSDRFIPSRTGSNFSLFDISPSANSPAEGREDCSGAYATLLRTALFGPDAGVFPPSTPDKLTRLDGKNSSVCPPSRNIFRYKTETRQSMHSLSPFGFEDALTGVSYGPVKAPRKVPRSPYKAVLMGNERALRKIAAKIMGSIKGASSVEVNGMDMEEEKESVFEMRPCAGHQCRWGNWMLWFIVTLTKEKCKTL